MAPSASSTTNLTPTAPRAAVSGPPPRMVENEIAATIDAAERRVREASPGLTVLLYLVSDVGGAATGSALPRVPCCSASWRSGSR